jgi:hypothetical protein
MTLRVELALEGDDGDDPLQPIHVTATRATNGARYI